MSDRAIKAIFILVVVVVVPAVFAPYIIGRIDQYDIARLQKDIAAVSAAVNAHKNREGSYPNSLSQIFDSADQEPTFVDPWGTPYIYSTDQPIVASEKLPFYVWSMGRDNRLGGEGIDQDRGNWK